MTTGEQELACEPKKLASLEKKPDVIWAEEIRNTSIPGYWFETPDDETTEYLRAEPVKELLKQAREAIYLASLQALELEDQREYTTIYTAIDKFLGEK